MADRRLYGATLRIDAPATLSDTDSRIREPARLESQDPLHGSYITKGSLTEDLFQTGLEPIKIVTALPSLPDANYPQGAVVFLTTDNKLYRSTGSAWTTAVNGLDIEANSILTNHIAAGQVTAAKISVSQLDAITASMGILTSGQIRGPSNTNGINFSGAGGIPAGWTTGITFENSVGSMVRYVNFAAPDGSPWIKCERLDIRGGSTGTVKMYSTESQPMFDLSNTVFLLQNNSASPTQGVNILGTLPSGWTRYLNLNGSGTFLKHDKLELKYDGSATFSGIVDILDGDLSGFTITNVGNVSLVIRDSQVAHGMTDIAPTEVAGALGTSDLGALAIVGFSDSGLQPGLYLVAHTPDPVGTDVGAILIDTFKKSGTSRVNYGSDEVAIQMPAFRIFGGRDNTAGKVEVDRVIVGAFGSNSAPEYSFKTDENTGMYRSAADELSFATGGVQRLQIKTDVIVPFLGLWHVGINKAPDANIWLDIADDGNGFRVVRGSVDLRLFDSTTEAFMGTESNHNLTLRRNATNVARFSNSSPGAASTSMEILANKGAGASLMTVSLTETSAGSGIWMLTV